MNSSRQMLQTSASSSTTGTALLESSISSFAPVDGAGMRSSAGLSGLLSLSSLAGLLPLARVAVLLIYLEHIIALTRRLHDGDLAVPRSLRP